VEQRRSQLVRESHYVFANEARYENSWKKSTTSKICPPNGAGVSFCLLHIETRPSLPSPPLLYLPFSLEEGVWERARGGEEGTGGESMDVKT